MSGGAMRRIAALVAASFVGAASLMIIAPAAALAEEAHWSVADAILPHSVSEAASHLLGKSWVGGEPVTKLNHVFYAIVSFVLVVLLLVFARARMKREEQSMLPAATFSPLAFFQTVTDMLLGLMAGLLGREKAMHFLPLVGSFGIFILVSNLLGLIPGFLPPTNNLNTTFALGAIVFVATHYYGIRHHGPAYLKHFLGPIIKWYALPLMLLMLAIELISHIARPVSLAIRLFGNMFGDHAAIAAFLGVPGMFLFIPLLPLPLGILVCVVQALVFCILSTVYIHLATEEAEEGGHH
ncbi:MAG: F0F1 ATP synthase subunit A [Deltaproteobacteria bacterium]|nr:F0F1 ATP synthase subunit A [Deltaproteobacteria bacterium]